MYYYFMVRQRATTSDFRILHKGTTTRTVITYRCDHSTAPSPLKSNNNASSVERVEKRIREPKKQFVNEKGHDVDQRKEEILATIMKTIHVLSPAHRVQHNRMDPKKRKRTGLSHRRPASLDPRSHREENGKEEINPGAEYISLHPSYATLFVPIPFWVAKPIYFFLLARPIVNF